VREVHERCDLPIFCIGGVKQENLMTVTGAGALRVVIVSGILLANDIVGYCKETKRILVESNSVDDVPTDSRI
jgi:thiamine-phosphate pyrophosphorylase